MDTDWESKYPLVSVCTLEHIVQLSDHAPILLTTGLPKLPCKHPFKFELGWLQREGFQDLVNNVWERPVSGNNPILRWNNKMRAMRRHLSGWARHRAGILEKEKLRLSTIIDELESLAEVRLLSSDEIELKSQSNAQITSLLREEELKWYQRSKDQLILEGDLNARYFHGIANGRHRRKHIQSLVQDEGRIEGHEQLKLYITNYYKGLFDPLEESSFSL
jgi:hypothetical protein